MFGPIDYIVKKIEGDYATLVNVDDGEETIAENVEKNG